MVYKIQVMDMKGKKVKEVTLSKDIFDDGAVNETLIHEYVVMYLANKRQSSAHTKTRGEVQRSGKKLYNQKWWGRARVGDAGSPIRRSGGIAMWPSNERNRSKDMPAKMKRKALCGALTLKAKAKWLIAVDKYISKEGKTKQAYEMLTQIGLDNSKTLLVLSTHDENIEISFRNIAHVRYTTSAMLNAYDVMNYKNLLFIGDAMNTLEHRLLKK